MGVDQVSLSFHAVTKFPKMTQEEVGPGFETRLSGSRVQALYIPLPFLTP